MVSFDRIRKAICILFLSLAFGSMAYAAGNVIDVSVSEYVYEEVMYNPLKATSGIWADPHENQSIYSINGSIVIANNHVYETVYNVNVSFTGLTEVYNLVLVSGNGTLSINGGIATVYLPELENGTNATLTYLVNTSNVKPALNFTTSYSRDRVFSGNTFDVVDRVENVLDATYPVTCIYDINITQRALDVNQSGTISDFFFVAPIVGTDAVNALVDPTNKTVEWNVSAFGCLNMGASTDIGYGIDTPGDIAISSDYKFVNSTIAYKLNTTISKLSVVSISGSTDLDLAFDKKINETLSGDNATWEVVGNVSPVSDITINLTQVSFWVSVRDGTGTGFTNPSIVDLDTISGSVLARSYNPNLALNNSLAAWNSGANPWYFNYTFLTSPIVWMDLNNTIIDDGLQLTNRSITYGDNEVYVKEIYVVTGYWIEITKNITRLSNNTYSVLITVYNLGSTPTPSNQVVQIYNFIPVSFSLVSPFQFSSSTWYDTVSANEVLNDPVYNGTMYQFGLIADTNPYNSSLDAWNGGSNANNTWSVEFNVSGLGEFDFEDLFLTGVDPLHVNEVGTTKTLTSSGVYGVVSGKIEYLLIIGAVILGLGALLL